MGEREREGEREGEREREQTYQKRSTNPPFCFVENRRVVAL